jgi:hypothetical protein
VLDAYSRGVLTKEQLEEYNGAKERYLKAKGLSDSAIASTTSPPLYINKTIPQPVYIAAISAGALAALQAQQKHLSQQQTIAAIQQAIYVHTGAQSQPVVEQLTQTAEQIANQTATKAGLQTTTGTAIKGANQTASQTQEQDQTQEQEQTKTQTMTQTQTATHEAVNENENESAKENENEAAAENEMAAAKLPKPKSKQGGTPELTAKDVANATTHRAGFGYWFFSDGRWRFLKQLPPGAKPVKSGKGSGYASVQTIRGKPIITQHRMGAVTVTINRPGYQPGQRGAISYRPSGSGSGRPSLSMTRQGQTVHIKGVGVVNAGRIPRGRVLRRRA